MTATLDLLHAVLATVPNRIIACSGGIDSLLLATMAHRAEPASTVVAHTVTPAVPGLATGRVVAFAEREGWKLEIIRSGEFSDERYLSNPTDRCYFCKTNLYDAIATLRSASDAPASWVVLSGANQDDLGEYRPGLIAADEHEVRHPYVEAGWTKTEIRAAARELGLPEADLPASPCLASRVYTGTRVTAGRLQAIEVGEEVVTEMTGIRVVRCRLRGGHVSVEVQAQDRPAVGDKVLVAVEKAMTAIEPNITEVRLDPEDYRPGRAFLKVN